MCGCEAHYRGDVPCTCRCPSHERLRMSLLGRPVPRRHPTQNRTFAYLVNEQGQRLAEAEYANQMYFVCTQAGRAIRVVDYQGTSLYEISPMYLVVSDSAQITISLKP